MSTASEFDLIVKPNFQTKSAIWRHFGFPADDKGRITDKKKTICRLCQAVVAYSGNTTNLKFHLQRCHAQEYLALQQQDSGDQPGPSRASAVKTTSTQLTISGTLAKSTPFSNESAKHKQLVDATADFICQGLQPLSVVDEPAFRRLLQLAEPRFNLPHRTYFTNTVIPAKYRLTRAAIEKQLAAVETCAVTTDLWTSLHQQRAYISLTAHFVDSDFKHHSKCLQTLEIPQDHDASSLKDVLTSMFEDWKIAGKVCGGITDNASNMVNAFRLMGIEHFPCVAHTLQLSIGRGLGVTRVQRVLGRCKKLVTHFKKSTKETYKLREKQEMLQLPQHMLIQDCVTRWGSTLAMLERLMEQQAPIAAVLMDGKVRHLMPEGEEWSVIEVLVDILKPFQQATEAMGAVSYPTLNTVKPLLYKLVNRTLEVKENDTVVAKEVKLNIKRDLQERYSTPSVARILNITTFLDPRYKELPFLDQLTRRRIIDEVQDELLVMEETEKEDPPEVEEVIEGEPPSKKKKGPVEKIIGELFESHTQQHLPLHSDKVQKELDMYKAESPPDLDSDPLAWWSSRKELYPLMSKLVQRMFSFVATSVPSERLFSTTGNVITDKHNRLTSEHADQLIFLFENPE